MTRARDIADLVDANGDIVAGALDNVPAADLVNDTTPQLGGNLDLNSSDITGTGNIDVTGNVLADTFSVGSVQTKPLFQIIPIDSDTATVINNTNWNAITGTIATVTITKTNTLRQYLVQIPGEIDATAGNTFAKVYRKVDSASYAPASTTTNLNFATGATNGTVNSTVQFIDTQTYNAGQVIKYQVYVKVQNSNSNLELGQNNLAGNTGIANNIQGFLMEYDNS